MVLIEILDEKKKSITQLFHFVWTGVVSTLVDVFILYFLVEYFYLYVMIATTISILIATSINYILNINYVFIGGKFEKRIEILLFFILAGFGLIFNIFLMWVFYSLLSFWYIWARILAIGLNVIINFIIKKYIIFLG